MLADGGTGSPNENFRSVDVNSRAEVTVERKRFGAQDAMQLAVQLRREGFHRAAEFLEREIVLRSREEVRDPEWRPV